MKIFAFVVALFCTFFSIGQKSYYFSSPLYASNKTETVNSRYFGTYIDDKGRKYVFNEKGISIVSTIVTAISREQLRESSKYRVSNGYMHGVVEGDSIPCVLEGENYYFGVRNTDVMIGTGSMNILTSEESSTDTYYINLYQNGTYIPMKITFKGRKLTITNLDYDIDKPEFSGIENQKEIKGENQTIVVLSPTKSELNTIDSYFSLPSVLKLQ